MVVKIALVGSGPAFDLKFDSTSTESRTTEPVKK
jgi:hypothetical protein